MAINNFIFLGLLMFTFSCIEKSGESSNAINIDIDASGHELTPGISIGSIQHLETSDSSVFGNISSAEFYSNRLYILDVYTSRALLVFSGDSGKFINKTKLGNGPSEVVKPNSFFVEKETNTVLVYDQVQNEFINYDLDLNFLQKERYEGVPILDFAKLEDDKILVRSHFNQDFSFSLYKKDYSSKRTFVKDVKYEGAQGLFKAISLYEGGAYLISSFNYNIYKWDGQNVKSIYHIDLGMYGVDAHDVEKLGLAGFWSSIKSGEKVTPPMGIDGNQDYILFHVIYKSEPISYLYIIDSDMLIPLDHYVRKGLLPKSKIIGFHGTTFYAIVEPQNLIDYQNKNNLEIVKNPIDPFQNPYFMTFDILGI